MPLRTHCSMLLALIALYCIGTVFANPASEVQDHCRCLKTTGKRIDTRLFKKMEILPAGPYCPTPEIIVVLRNGGVVCVDPEAEWIKRVINNAIRRRAQKK